MADEIFDCVRRMGNVTFVELEKHVTGFGGGDKTLMLSGDRFSNIVMWVGLTDAA